MTAEELAKLAIDDELAVSQRPHVLVGTVKWIGNDIVVLDTIERGETKELVVLKRDICDRYVLRRDPVIDPEDWYVLLDDGTLRPFRGLPDPEFAKIASFDRIVRFPMYVEMS